MVHSATQLNAFIAYMLASELNPLCVLKGLMAIMTPVRLLIYVVMVLSSTGLTSVYDSGLNKEQTIIFKAFKG